MYETLIYVLVGIGAAFAGAKLYLSHAAEEKWLSHLEKTNIAFQERLNKYLDAQMHMLVSENMWKEGRKIAQNGNQ